MMIRKVAVAAFALLAGCAPPSAGTTTDAGPFSKLSAFTVKDLQNADKMAVASGDVLAHACYPALITWIQSFPSDGTVSTVSGAVSAFQFARQTRGAFGRGIPDTVKLGCGGLLIDEQSLILRLGAMAVVP